MKLNYKPLCLSVYILIFLLPNQIFTQSETLLLREPTLSRDDVVFVYANDLWKASRSGGQATRMTSNEGKESLPHFSPDEKWIAFSGEYDGNTDVYLIPVEGGQPKRLTFHPGGDYVQGWTPDGKVLFRSGRYGHPTQTNTLYTVGMDGSLPTDMRIPRAAYGEISSDGLHVAYTPITSWDPEWRNYRGGQAMPIWIVNMQSLELTRVPQPDKERHLDPVWYNGKVFYLSERDYASNIWSYDPQSGKEEQLTYHDQFDVKSLDAGPDAIVYQQGGKLHLLNPGTKAIKSISIKVEGDMNFARPRWEDVSAARLQNPNISATGQRAIFEYRGDIFTFPKEEGSWRNLTQTSGVADRYPTWSPKGDKIAWFSDKTGEYQLVVADQFGKVEKNYSLPNPTFYFTPDWSPDGKKIAYTDTDYNIWYINLDSGVTKKADTDRYAHPNRAMNPKWSPDSKWLLYAKQQDSHFKAAFLHNTDNGATHQITESLADVISPVWDPSGKYIYLLASSDYGLNSGWLDMSSYDPQVSRSLFAILLSKDTPSPLLPKSDEEKIKEEEKDDQEKKPEDKEEESTDLSIDIPGIQQRQISLGLKNGEYAALYTGPKNHVFVMENKNDGTLHKFNIEKNKADEFLTGVSQVSTTQDGNHVLLRKGSQWIITETKSAPKGNDGQLKIDAAVKINPLEEYHQIFREGWRYMRDFLYVDNVHGAPWDDVYVWYAPWINHVRHRTDLNYVVDILSGEVAIGHSYVSGGDMPDIDRVPVGLLGCDFAVKGNHYVISKIYPDTPWETNAESPLAQPGIKVEEGDYLLAINGTQLNASDNPYRLLEQSAGRTISIMTGKTTAMESANRSFVRPIGNESQLRGMHWVESNRKKVDELSGGKLAYVYVPNTSGLGFSYFNKYYFSQQDKKGVVIDERNNGGGSAADYMIDIMNRKLFGYFNSKTNDHRPWTTPMAGIWGPKVMIINERAGSGGDLLPYMFRAAGIGPLVGTRTWGGLVGTWDTPRFIDGGRMVAPRGGFYDVNGEWAVEGEGISPDIEIIQDPVEVIKGHDPQLEAAVKEALRLLQTDEFKLKPEPDAPVRWKRPESFNKNKK